MKNKILLKLLLLCAFAFGIFVGALPAWARKTFGKRLDFANAADVLEVRRFIYLAQPAVHAIERFHAEHQRYPADLTELKDLPANYLASVFGETFPSWRFLKGEPDYKLVMKLGWDPILTYDRADNTWTYDPGDGTAEWAVTP